MKTYMQYILFGFLLMKKKTTKNDAQYGIEGNLYINADKVQTVPVSHSIKTGVISQRKLS